MSRRTLLAEVIAHYPQAGAVATAQCWSTPTGTRRTLILTHNGLVIGRADLTAARAEQEMAAARVKLADNVVDDDTARTALYALGVDDVSCLRYDCGQRLPIGAPWCAQCGASQRQVAAGIVSGASRRPVIDMTGRS